MKAWAMQVFITALISRLDEPTMKAWLDAGLDKLEDMIINSETVMDDAFLPIIQQVRAVFDVPDYPDSPPPSA